MIQGPRGTKDIFADEAYLWNTVENIIKNVFYRFNFDEIRTPIFESTELFNRSVGENSDIVQKEMYTFKDKSGRNLTLKPEGTAAVVRSAIQNNLFETNPKLFYIISAFRYERPQSGRYREFHQCGAESFGIADSSCDAQIILLAHEILNTLGIKNISLKINSIGCEKCRAKYNSVLKNFIVDNLKNLCTDCQNRFNLNPMRILDCKNDLCKKISSNSPSILDFLCDDCRTHFCEVKKILSDLSIDFSLDNKIVRGLDYYTRTVFEFIYDEIAICGGGRYDKLVFELGGLKIPAVGFAFGFERLISIIKSQHLFVDFRKKLNLFIGNLNEKTIYKSILIANNLRRQNFSVEYNDSQRSIKSQIKTALKLNTDFFCVLGDDEINTGQLKIKDMRTKSETQINIDSINKFLLSEEK